MYSMDNAWCRDAVHCFELLGTAIGLTSIYLMFIYIHTYIHVTFITVSARNESTTTGRTITTRYSCIYF